MTSRAPVLFLGLDGVLRLPSGVAPYARPFVHWATRHFDVRWLTTRPPAEVFRFAEVLGLPGDSVFYAGFRHSRVEPIETVTDFRWIDASLHPDEMNWLRARGAERFLQTDPAVGVMPVHKAALEAALRVAAAPAAGRTR